MYRREVKCALHRRAALATLPLWQLMGWRCVAALLRLVRPFSIDFVEIWQCVFFPGTSAFPAASAVALLPDRSQLIALPLRLWILREMTKKGHYVP